MRWLESQVDAETVRRLAREVKVSPRVAMQKAQARLKKIVK